MSILRADQSALEVDRLRARISDLEAQLRATPSAHAKAADEAVHQQKEWLRVTLTSIGDAVLATDAQGRIAFANPVAARLTGWTEPEALGRRVQDIFRIISENTREDGDDIVARVLSAGQTVTLADNTALLTRDGREIPIEDSAAPIRDAAGNVAGVVLVFRDVTDKRRVQRALRESEQRVRRKLESILSPEGDISQLELGDIIDVQAIQSLMDDFYALARIPMALLDRKGKVLVGVGWQEICTRFHRVHPESCKHCTESDTQLSAGVPGGECRLYKCKNNMWDIATPLMIGGQHVGNLFSGQFFFEGEPLDYELFRGQAQRFGFDETEYLAALERVPRLSKALVQTGMAFLAKLGHMLSLLSYSNIKLARSVAERESLMGSLTASAERLRRSQEIAHLGSWELDLVGNRLSWSDEVYRIFGLEPQEFGASYDAFLEAVHPGDRSAVDAAYSGSLREGKDSYEITHRVVRRGTGEVRWVEERCEHVRDASGRIVRSIGMVQDITERARAERALREAQKLESIGLLAGGIAHDFNNLLTSILGNASLLQMRAQAASREQLNAIIEASERAASLTRQLLAYAGKGKIEIADFDIARLVRSSADLLRASIAKNVELAFDVPLTLPAVRGDSSQIQQVIMNLVINAAEAIDDRAMGRVSVVAGTRELSAAAARCIDAAILPGRYVSIAVRDNGCGMDEQTKGKIFEPFFTTKFMGRGLGLAAVQGILRSHNGTITVESSPSHGSTFTVYLPFSETQATDCADALTPGRSAKTVLVVDDDEPVRAFTKAALERVGHKVLLVENGRQALELLDAGDEVDLVLLEVLMPVVGWAEALSDIRKMWPNLAVLVASGYGRQELQRLGIPADLLFLEKPYTAQTLVAAVDKALEAARPDTHHDQGRC